MARRRPAVGRLRGKSQPGRLRLWEDAIAALWPDLLALGAVDLGVGEDPVTAGEWAARLGGLTAVELHPRRAAAARSVPGLTVLECDALVPPPGASAGVARCANLLRQYPIPQVPAAHAALVGWVRPGGVVVAGSCDRGGHVGAFVALRRGPRGPSREALVFLTDLTRGFAPIQLRDQLPRELRWSVQPNTPMGTFFSAWTAQWEATRSGHPRADFCAAAALPDCALLDLPSGWGLVWRPPGGVPAGRIARRV